MYEEVYPEPNYVTFTASSKLQGNFLYVCLLPESKIVACAWNTHFREWTILSVVDFRDRQKYLRIGCIRVKGERKYF